MGWRGAFVACLLNAVASPVDLVIGRHVPGMPVWPPLVSSATGLCLAIVLLLARTRASARFGVLVFVVNNAVIIAALWITSTHYAMGVAHWFPYQAYKLGALAAAFLAPSLVSGLVSVLAFPGAAVLHFLHLPPGIREHLFGEPWASLAYGLFGVVVLSYSMRQRRLELAVVRARAEAAAIERAAEDAMAMRDLANTPLQTIVFTFTLLRARVPELSPQAERIERAVARLAEINRIEVFERGDGRAAPGRSRSSAGK